MTAEHVESSGPTREQDVGVLWEHRHVLVWCKCQQPILEQEPCSYLSPEPVHLPPPH